VSKKRLSLLLEKSTFTPYELISLIISFLGLISIVAGLLSLAFFYRQTREIATQTQHSQESLQSAAYQAIANHEMEVDKLFIENSKLRPYFFAGQEINESDPDYGRAESIADYELDFIDSAQSQLKYLKNPEIDMNAWQQYFDDSFTNSPILCRRLSKLANWYKKDFVDRERGVCSKARKIEAKTARKK
jgi:NhaP-type Na+/H+ or K+/H+ antiporter